MGRCCKRHSQAVDELIRDGENGWVFDPINQESTVAALDRALKTPAAKLADMKEACRASMAAFTPEVIAERMRVAIVALHSVAGEADTVGV
jgi:glycosyltransferase involved in cell wall biosynthesis